MTLKWHDYFMGSIKAPMDNGAHYLINITSSGGGLRARYSDSKKWVWSENFSNGVDAKAACEAHARTLHQHIEETKE